MSFAAMGTSWQRVEQAMSGHSLRGSWLKNETLLKGVLSNNKPCVIMLDVGAIPEEGSTSWSGHWIVAYAYDADNIYLSNWPGAPRGNSTVQDGGKCSWTAFRKAWNTWLTTGNGTANIFFVLGELRDRTRFCVGKTG